MNAELPRDIRIERTTHGTRYILPRRDLAMLRPAGIGLLVFGAFVTAFMVFWMSGPIRGAFRDKDAIGIVELVFGLLGLPGLAVGIILLGAGLAVLTNRLHAEVIVERGVLKATEYIGPFRWTRTRVRRDIDRFVIAQGTRRTAGEEAPPAPWTEELLALTTEGATGKPFIVVPGYPRATVEAMGVALSDALQADGARLFNDRPPPLPIADAPEENCPFEPDAVVAGPPPDTDIVRQELDRGFTLAVPAAGLIKGSKGLFIFAIVWDAFIAVFAVIMVLAMTGGETSGNDAPHPAALLFLVPFFAVGIGLFVASIKMGRTRVLIAVTEDLLAVRRVTPFGMREHRIPREAIASIRRGPSGMSVNNVPVMELQLRHTNGKKFGILSQRTNGEIDWIAAQLNNGLFGSLRAPRRQ